MKTLHRVNPHDEFNSLCSEEDTLRSTCIPMGWGGEHPGRRVHLTLCDPMDYTIHGLLQARILEWVAIHCSRGSSQPRY